MIPSEEAHDLSQSFGVPLVHIEKDYVMSWLLWGITQDSRLLHNLILKGGNCLRKLYFPDTRFSDDLDFTTRHQLDATQFKNRIQHLLKCVSDVTGISFLPDQTQVKEKPTPHEDLSSIAARVYFRGFAGDSSLTLRIKFDVSPYEKIVLPVQQHTVIHSFSDANLCQARVFGYSLEEILAEKLRSWIQRTRARDLFDVVKIIQSERLPVSKRNILSAFVQKTLFKDIPNVGRDELLSEQKFQIINSHWQETIVCPTNAIIVAANAITLFQQFINALFQPDLLLEVQNLRMPRVWYPYCVPSTIRETIIAAGRARQLIRLRYHGYERNVEPYSFLYKIRKKDGCGVEYFYGYDITRGKRIKSFFLHEIQSVSIIPEKFQPRFIIEF